MRSFYNITIRIKRKALLFLIPCVGVFYTCQTFATIYQHKKIYQHKNADQHVRTHNMTACEQIIFDTKTGQTFCQYTTNIDNHVYQPYDKPYNSSGWASKPNAFKVSNNPEKPLNFTWMQQVQALKVGDQLTDNLYQRGRVIGRYPHPSSHHVMISIMIGHVKIDFYQHNRQIIHIFRR